MSNEEEEEAPTFSTVTLSRLFHTIAFENDDTRINQKTLQLSSEYLRMFTREAILRANEVRLREASGRTADLDVHLTTENEREFEGRNEELVENVLDVRHLKVVAGLLILDF